MGDFCDEMIRISGGKKQYRTKYEKAWEELGEKNEQLQAENKRLKEALGSIKVSSWDAQTSRLMAQQALREKPK